VFLIFKMVPGDEATLMAGATASRADIELLRARLGLDRPLLEQYAARVAGLVRGDFGYSPTFRGNPLPHVLARIPATLVLLAAAIALTVVVGVPAGVLGAVRHDGWPDYVVSLLVVGLLAIPNFWLGLMLIAGLSVDRGWLPSFGFTGWASLVMPTLALAARLVALVARMTRGVMLEELAKDYVRTAYGAGLPPYVVIGRNVLRNALVTPVTALGLQIGYLIGGAVVIEAIFSLPGMGTQIMSAVTQNDAGLARGVVVVIALGFVVVNFLVDVLYLVINPRLRGGH
jgi:ABC-type dipeptide/oligopeptide/nickel transport system permease component